MMCVGVGGREMRATWASGFTVAEIRGRRGACEAKHVAHDSASRWAALDRDQVQIHSVHSAKTEMAERVGQVAGSRV